MQRLIMTVNSSDGCTWSNYETYPVMGESPEALLVEFLEQKKLAGEQGFFFKGVEFNDGYTDDPDFLTIDEWYKWMDA